MTSIACVGDKTTHGGFVISGSDMMDINGRKAARIGDLVSCPEHGVNAIIEGSDFAMDADGRKFAMHGHRTACGCRLIALGEHATIRG
ncbi:putative Zn-binding protein involved in type VI secretion [Paraburkholderia bannensis]|uniref:Putative Zn-binding protein involved in type VI secretion n=1 Tax=Paraburkholderia bannensis TaxID=765414 RepID=A0A7W9TXK2_9BURK|nr:MULTISPECIES: PAAR domain-containing protein [Paraburkholderia]MBB3257533.1 putative Zn-binding protein involved in type VI secretion [Paraburkholderia sp. WP4_3_2]MBB6102546.1 putative Zn-binding protein involved in type VI secretion [Paraburkholderia bannensis]